MSERDRAWWQQRRADGRQYEYEPIRQLMIDPAISLGQKLTRIRIIQESANLAERSLLMQIGVDVAKDLINRGHLPDGRTIGEHYEAVSGE